MKKTFKLLASAALMGSAATALAFTNGANGVDSTATIDVSLSKGSLVRISGIAQDAVFGNFQGVGNADQSIVVTACVFSNTGNYTITASGTADLALGNSFVLDDGAGTQIPYAVTFGATALTNTPVPTTTGTLVTAETADDTCGGVNNLPITFDVLGADIDAAPQGVYADTVTFFMEPV